ncbi:MAG: 30S ribosomal protein S4 [Candidatus Magasanikbacteria bacterium GW2011_GWC2_37_14]|uniref:Small ribosomal subunit protein uS4 n=1 Tax=Candidatus Magasanikbacteria bacterium GW2011_GWC2_37_14 TaxID=1619046 RepID=A0A0G0IVK4_9BACT|nr:MAG: 30S ribosomal protein S4 [Candidatus Magasanikbacteria bacterium GW2011_GWC2_37_14]
MPKYIGPKNKIARRFGVNLGLKTNSTKVARRLSQMPGVHGPKKRPGANSSYGKQLLEKQKAKLIYGLRERQFRRYVDLSRTMKGDSGLNLQRLLELRLDNVIYRLGFAVTRSQARQFVNHGMFKVNGKKINIPSHLLKIGDEVTLAETKTKKKIFEGVEDRLSKVELASWLVLDAAKKQGKILNLPAETDFEKVFDVKLITEYYSTR